jgi:hypothetical protein
MYLDPVESKQNDPSLVVLVAVVPGYGNIP